MCDNSFLDLLIQVMYLQCLDIVLRSRKRIKRFLKETLVAYNRNKIISFIWHAEQHKSYKCPDAFTSWSLWIISGICLQPAVSRTEPTFICLMKNMELSVTETTVSTRQTIANMESGQTSHCGKGRVNGTVADTSICLSCHESLVWCCLWLLEGQFIA